MKKAVFIVFNLFFYAFAGCSVSSYPHLRFLKVTLHAKDIINAFEKFLLLRKLWWNKITICEGCSSWQHSLVWLLSFHGLAACWSEYDVQISTQTSLAICLSIFFNTIAFSQTNK